MNSESAYEFPIPDYQQLLAWNMKEQFYPMVDPRSGVQVDYHRLQLEYWLWMQNQLLNFPPGLIIDVGAEYRRNFSLENNTMWTVNDKAYPTPYGPCNPDILLSVLSLRNEFKQKSVAVAICTETLEHVAYPQEAVDELCLTLISGGILLLTTPFLWPEHGDENFEDYWRFTETGLRHLIWATDGMDVLEVRPTIMRNDSRNLTTIIRHNEVMDPTRRWPTGFMLKARKR